MFGRPEFKPNSYVCSSSLRGGVAQRGLRRTSRTQHFQLSRPSAPHRSTHQQPSSLHNRYNFSVTPKKKKPLGDSPPKPQQSLLTTKSSLKPSFSKITPLMRSENCSLKIRPQRGNMEVTGFMRVVVVDWLMQVCAEMGVGKETLFSGVSLLDRVVERSAVGKQDYQLHALVCLMLAHKVESRRTITPLLVCALMDGSVAPQQVTQLEQRVLRLLKFRLHPPTAWTEMQLLLKAVESWFGSEVWRGQEGVLRGRMGWILEGHLLQMSYEQEGVGQRDICLSILYELLAGLHGDTFGGEYEAFCCELLGVDSFSVESLRAAKLSLGKWWGAKCECGVDSGGYHGELRGLVGASDNK